MPVRQTHQICPRVGYRRTAGFRDQADVLSGQKGGDQAFQRIGWGVFVEFQQCDC